MIGKDLKNPIPQWAEHGADRKFVPYGIASNMNTPRPDPGEEYPHINTDLFGLLDPKNRFMPLAKMVAPYNAPDPSRQPTMDGFVTDYISAFTAEKGRQPTYEEYSQIMAGYTPEQMPVTSTLARGFATFDRWFCEVLADVHEPFVLSCGQCFRLCQQLAARVRFPNPQHRGDALRTT